MSESIIIVALAVCWAGYFGWYLRLRFQSSTQDRDEVSSFSQGLGTLGAAQQVRGGSAMAVHGSSPLVPRGGRGAARRRRDVAVALGMACLTTLFAALAFGSVYWALHILSDIAAGSFVSLATRRRSIVAEREMKVHTLYPDRVIDHRAAVGVGRVANG
ncbi:MAG: hypothetical protein OXB92_03650 [Acidimicrobiaceae bacterium]|nr:hypothetical protein [Acidimicrobiia bacterium]MCY4492937.1 hypothetical protein [Acidimicrobiaceae bacterium]